VARVSGVELAGSGGEGEGGEHEREGEEVEAGGGALPGGGGERGAGVMADVREAPVDADVAGDEGAELVVREVVGDEGGVGGEEAEQHGEAGPEVAARAAEHGVGERGDQDDAGRLLAEGRCGAQQAAEAPCPERPVRRDRLGAASAVGEHGEEDGGELGQQGPGDVVGVHAVEVGVVEGAHGGGGDGGGGTPQAPGERGDQDERGEAEAVGGDLQGGDVGAVRAGEQGGEVEAAGALPLDAVDVGEAAAAQQHGVVEDAADVVRGEAALGEAGAADERREQDDERRGQRVGELAGGPACTAGAYVDEASGRHAADPRRAPRVTICGRSVGGWCRVRRGLAVHPCMMRGCVTMQLAAACRSSSSRRRRGRGGCCRWRPARRRGPGTRCGS
jgi:hypothetical protein